MVATLRNVDESKYVQIGGIDQFLSFRGEDPSNPVILFLQGGPRKRPIAIRERAAA